MLRPFTYALLLAFNIQIGISIAIIDTPATNAQLWTVHFYYNYALGVHAFCADPPCYNAIQSNGIGYDPSNGRGSLGRAIIESQILSVQTACPIGSLNLKHLAFTKVNLHYVHNLNGIGLKQGWVSTVNGACEATVPIKRWKSRFSDDLMYGVNLEWNTWYQGMVQDGGAVQFYMWPATLPPPPPPPATTPALPPGPTTPPTTAPPLATTAVVPPPTSPPIGPPGDFYFYYNFLLGVHAYCADPPCYNAIQSNGIGYDPVNGKGLLGKAIAESHILSIQTSCPIGSLNLKHLAFTEVNLHYVHNLNGIGLKQGWVSTVNGACGATLPIKRWKSSFSDDLMYGRDLAWNTWYKGMVQDDGAVQFYMWTTPPPTPPPTTTPIFLPGPTTSPPSSWTVIP